MENYQLIDCGNGRRLEKFGAFRCDRPAPAANFARRAPAALWQAADLFFATATQDWRGALARVNSAPNWEFIADDLRLQLSLGKNGQLGVFPEQLAQWRWLQETTARALVPPQVLNTFAHTGAATLYCARAGARVCQVEAARAAVNTARRNAELSNLSNAPIRWLVDDVMKFLLRERRRGNFYDGIILDPPAFGRAGKHVWQLTKNLPELLAAATAILHPQPLFFLLTCHQTGWTAADLHTAVAAYFPAAIRAQAEYGELKIRGEYNDLPAGCFWRYRRNFA